MESKYCAAPWRGLHVNLDGDVRVCCAGRPGMLGNINQQSIHTILQSPALKEIQESVQQGQLHPTYCDSCIQQDAAGHTERTWHNDISPEFDPRTSNLEHRPAILDIRWSNTCNFACTYCSPYFSSTWGQVQKEPIRSLNRLYFDELNDYVIENSHYLRDIAMLGGEPLLLNWNQQLVESLPEDTQVTVITNLGVDLDNNAVFHALAQRKTVHWRVSLENIEERFEYVRQNGNWSTMQRNIETLLSLPGHRVGAHAIYHVYNCTRLCEFRQWAQQFFYHVQWQHIGQDYLDPRYHEVRVRQQAQDEINNFLQMDLDQHEHDFFKDIIKTIDQFDVNLGESFRKHVKNDEEKFFVGKKRKFQDLWPELAWVIDGT